MEGGGRGGGMDGRGEGSVGRCLLTERARPERVAAPPRGLRCVAPRRDSDLPSMLKARAGGSGRGRARPTRRAGELSCRTPPRPRRVWRRRRRPPLAAPVVAPGRGGAARAGRAGSTQRPRLRCSAHKGAWWSSPATMKGSLEMGAEQALAPGIMIVCDSFEFT